MSERERRTFFSSYLKTLCLAFNYYSLCVLLVTIIIITIIIIFTFIIMNYIMVAVVDVVVMSVMLPLLLSSNDLTSTSLL